MCVTPESTALVLDLEDRLDLDGDAAGERGSCPQRSNHFARLAEDFDHQVGEAVDHLGLLGEVGRAVDHAQHLDQPDDLVERGRAGCGWSRGSPGRSGGRRRVLLRHPCRRRPGRRSRSRRIRAGRGRRHRASRRTGWPSRRWPRASVRGNSSFSSARRASAPMSSFPNQRLRWRRIHTIRRNSLTERPRN